MILFVLCFLFTQPVNLSYANWNKKNSSETNNLSSNQVEEISLMLPKPPNFKDKVLSRSDEIINYDKLNNLQKWNWIFEYSKHCSHNKFQEIIKYININKKNRLIKLILNSYKIMGITEQTVSFDTQLTEFSHFIQSCNSKILDVYLVELNNLIKFFESGDTEIKPQKAKTKTSNPKIKSNSKIIKNIPNTNKKIKNKITNKTKDAEDKCTEIGFTKGTYEYGKCVLKLLDLK